MHNPADQNNSTTITQKTRLIPKPENPITKAIIAAVLIILAIIPVYSVIYAATGFLQSNSWDKVQASAIAQTGKNSLNPYTKTLFIEDIKGGGVFSGSSARSAFLNSPEANIIASAALGVEPCVSKNWSYFNVSKHSKKGL